MLIELAIAALVIGIGVLALLGLTHVAERAASDTEAETRATLFADDVFTTLRLHSDFHAQSPNQMQWVEFWVGVSEGDLAPPLTAGGLDVWQKDENEQVLAVVGDGDAHSIAWHAKQQQENESTPVISAVSDIALTYKLTIAKSGETTSLNSTQTNSPPTMLLATLHVWYGASKVKAEPFTFFTAFSHSGGLP